MPQISSDRIEFFDGSATTTEPVQIRQPPQFRARSTKPADFIEISDDRIEPINIRETENQWKKLYLRARPYLSVGLEGGLSTAGAIAGTGVGPLGTVLGGGLGYAAGKETLDLLDQAFGVQKPKPVSEELQEAARRTATGFALTAGGEVLGSLIGGAVGKIGGMKPLAKRAGKKLAQLGSAQTRQQISKNIKVARQLEETIPNLKFTYGQITNDADAIMLERALSRSGLKVKQGGVSVGAASLSRDQRAFAEKALQEYYHKKLLESGDIKNLITNVSRSAEKLSGKVKISQEEVNKEVKQLLGGIDDQETGRVILNRLKTLKAKQKKALDVLYSKIPDVKVQPDILYKRVKQLKKEFDPLIEDAEDFPVKMIRGIKTKLNPSGKAVKDIKFSELRKLRTQILDAKRKAAGSVPPNYKLSRRLNQLQEAVEETIEARLKDDTGMAGRLFRKASAKYKTYSEKFKQDVVADVLTKGKRGEESRIALSEISRRFFTKDGIDSFLRAVGDDRVARKAMKDFARYDFFNKTYNPLKETIDTTRAFGWLKRHRETLKKLGLYDDFMRIAGKKRMLDMAQSELDAFNKSVAGRILGSDVDRVVSKAFTGTSNYAERAKELLNLVKGDKAAEEGLKKAVSDHLLRSSKITAEGFFTDFKVSYDRLTKKFHEFLPALKVLYKNEPEKLKAINRVHKAYQILNRNISSPLGGGSDTAENLLNTLAAATGARAGQYYLIVSLRKFFSKLAENKINSYLLRATFDPDYALSLINLAKSGVKSPQFRANAKDRFKNLMSRLTVYGAEKVKEDVKNRR